MTDEETNFIQLSYDFEMLGLQRKELPNEFVPDEPYVGEVR